MRLLIVQYAGDYRETFKRFAEGGGETYYAQKYSVDAVAKIGEKIEEVAIICCMTAAPYNEVMQNGVRAIGAGFDKKINAEYLLKLIAEQKPTHLVAVTPIKEVFKWAIKHNIKTIATLADSYPTQGWRNKWRNYKLSNLLNNERIDWVGNHGINSCIFLQQIGVKTDKIIPWDWPAVVTPDSFAPKNIPLNVINTWNLVYVGAITEAKGVGDILESVAKLRAKKLPLSLKIAGKGEIEYFINKAKNLKIDDCVEFLGLVPHHAVVKLMREADIVLIPSRHEYTEGLPMTIYESLCSRTPIVASDHPMFKRNLKDGISAMIFPAGNSLACSECIEKLLSDPELYESISVNSSEAWQRIQIPVKWADMIERWLFDSPENQQWLFEHRLASGYYQLTEANC